MTALTVIACPDFCPYYVMMAQGFASQTVNNTG
jgi:hypothetical protein